MTGIVHIDDFFFWGRKKDKVGRSYNAKKKRVITTL